MKRSTPRLFALVLSTLAFIPPTPLESLVAPIFAKAIDEEARPIAPSTFENKEKETTDEKTVPKADGETAPLRETPVLSGGVPASTNDAPPSKKPRRRIVLRAAASADGETVETVTFIGREVADYRTQDGGGHFVLEDDLGKIEIFENARIVSIESEPEIDAIELASRMTARLEEEFGPEFKTKSTERYLFIYNVSDGYIEWCARLFESLADGFEKFTNKNNFETTNRDEPLVVVVFATLQEFNEYAKRDKIADPNRVAAYYNMETNRVVLRDLSGVEGDVEDPSRRRRAYQEVREILSRPNAAFNVATIVHEATHQIAFNRGLFLRTGPIPLWAVEGLSLVFETPNGKTSQGGWGYRGSFPTNERQFAAFQSFAARATTGDPLRDLIRQDKFYNDIQGSYSTSWALSYYLIKKRPRDWTRYLQKIAAKPPYTLYSPEERVADFEEVFGDDWEKLYRNLARFIRSL